MFQVFKENAATICAVGATGNSGNILLLASAYGAVPGEPLDEGSQDRGRIFVKGGNVLTMAVMRTDGEPVVAK
jgi:hypothetical protein